MVVDTATYWSPFGQVVILGLIQVGGFGFMTGSTLLLLLLVGRRTSLSSRIVAQESAGAQDLGSVRLVLRRVAVFSLVAEGIGTVVLVVAFLARYGDVAKAAWHGLFHSVSAFNNAGFDLMGGFASLTGFADDPFVFLPIGFLIVLGGLGVAIVADVLDKRRWTRLALETKLVLATTGVLHRRRRGRAARVRVAEPGHARVPAAGRSVRSTRCSSPSRSGRPASAPSPWIGSPTPRC